MRSKYLIKSRIRFVGRETLCYAWEDGKKEGLKEGIRKGEKGKTCNLIQKKLEKGKTLSQIADELEDTEENIGRLIEQFHLGIPQ